MNLVSVRLGEEGAVLSEGSPASASSKQGVVLERSQLGTTKAPTPGAQAGPVPVFGLALWHRAQAGLCVSGSPWQGLQPLEAFSMFTCPGRGQEGTQSDLLLRAELSSLRAPAPLMRGTWED